LLKRTKISVIAAELGLLQSSYW